MILKLVIKKALLSTGKKSKCYYIYKDEIGVTEPIVAKRFNSIHQASTWITCTYPQTTEFRSIQDGSSKFTNSF